MSNYTFQHTIHHMVYLDRFAHSMIMLMKKVDKFGIHRVANKLTPTIVHIRLPKNLREEHVPAMRRFLLDLKKMQASYFMRFTASLDGIFASENAGLFYTRDDVSDKFSDMTFDLRVVTEKHIEIRARIPFTTKQHLMLRSLTQIMQKPIPASAMHDQDAFFDLMLSFHQQHNLIDMIKHLNDDFHILFVPNRQKTCFFPIPLFGLSADDARKRYLASEASFKAISKKHPKAIGDRPYRQELLVMLVQSIQDNEELGDRCGTAHTTYGLAELLYGYYIAQGTSFDDRSNCHEMIIFDSEDNGEQCLVEVFNLHIRSVSI